MTRLDDLTQLRADLLTRMGSCQSDQNYAVLGRLFADVVKQIDDLEKLQPARKGTGLDEFTRRRAAKEAPRSKSSAGG